MYRSRCILASAQRERLILLRIETMMLPATLMPRTTVMGNADESRPIQGNPLAESQLGKLTAGSSVRDKLLRQELLKPVEAARAMLEPAGRLSRPGAGP